MSCYAAFYHSKGKFFNRVIRAYQKLKGYKYWEVSHCEFFFDHSLETNEYQAISSSAMDGGVRIKSIPYNPKKWTMIKLPDHYRANAIKFYKENRDAKYDFLAIMNFASRIFKQNKKRKTCAEALGEICGIEGNLSPAELISAVKDRHG